MNWNVVPNKIPAQMQAKLTPKYVAIIVYHPFNTLGLLFNCEILSYFNK